MISRGGGRVLQQAGITSWGAWSQWSNCSSNPCVKGETKVQYCSTIQYCCTVHYWCTIQYCCTVRGGGGTATRNWYQDLTEVNTWADFDVKLSEKMNVTYCLHVPLKNSSKETENGNKFPYENLWICLQITLPNICKTNYCFAQINSDMSIDMNS
jgi:hypothetical protein